MSAKATESVAEDWAGQRKALNDGGFFAHLELLEYVEKAGWKVCSDVQVSAAPFQFDPVNGIKKIASDESLVSSLLLPKAMVDGQSESMRRETTVDIVAIRRGRVLCVGIEKLDRNASWVFGWHSENEGFSALHKVASSENKDDLMHIPKTDNTGSLSMRMEPCNPWTSRQPNEPKFSTRRYDHGQSLTADDEGKYSYADRTVVEGARPILEGVFGLAKESLVRHVASGRGNDLEFIPVIATTANILACEYDRNSEPNTRLEERDAVIYDCPIPESVKFPNQVADFEDHERMRRAVRWPILIVNHKCLDRLFVDSTACA